MLVSRKNVQLSLLLISFFVLLVGVKDVHAATITVSPGESIQAAIDSAGSGDTVRVEPGTYVGNITIDRSITLTGVNK